MIIFVPFPVQEDALDWVGFVPSLDDSLLIVTEGRIGRTDNPLIYIDQAVDGGWYLESQEIDLRSDDARIDIMLDTYENDIFFLVRTDDPSETHTQRYELLIRYGWRERDDWYVSVPRSSSWKS